MEEGEPGDLLLIQHRSWLRLSSLKPGCLRICKALLGAAEQRSKQPPTHFNLARKRGTLPGVAAALGQTFLDKTASHLAYFLEELYIVFAYRELIGDGSA